MLSSGVRRGELHALDHSKTRWSHDRNEVTLRPNPFFVAKTHAPDRPNTAFQGFTIKSLSAGLERSDPDRLLCPIRTLKFYLHRTQSIRKGRTSLFLPLGKTQVSRGVHANTISSWIRKAVQLAYAAADQIPELRKLHNIRAHELRAIATSWDALKQISFSDILAACRWRTQTTFSDYYLRDLSCIEGDLLALRSVPTPSMSRLS